MCLPFWQSWTWHRRLLDPEEQDPGFDWRQGGRVGTLILHWIIKNVFVSFEFSSCNFFYYSNNYLLMSNSVSLMHCICLSWIHPFVFTILELCFLFSLWHLTLAKKLQAFRGRMTKQCHNLITVCYWTDLADDVQAFLSNPKHWSYKEDNP